MPPPVDVQQQPGGVEDLSPAATTRRNAIAAAGACGCGCGLWLALGDQATILDRLEAQTAELGKAKDERFMRVMSGGMRDYEAWDEVRGFKSELFRGVRKGDAVAEIGIGSAPNLQYYGARAKSVVAVEPNAARTGAEVVSTPRRASSV